MCSAIGSWVNPVADAEFWKLRVDRESGGRSTRRVEFSAYDYSQAHGARSPIREHGKRKFLSGSEHLFTNSVGIVPIIPRPATQQLQRPFAGPRAGIETARDVMFPRESLASTNFSASSVSTPAASPLSPRNPAPFGTQLQPIALQSQRSQTSLSSAQRGFGRPLRTPFASRLR